MARDEMISWLKAHGWTANWELTPDDELRRWVEIEREQKADFVIEWQEICLSEHR
ncbi:hypothetical protein UFOVP1414_21 [uncultured Caudovirales phage]|uniref:Uncharacterized protein n=1 Tax=uncultured Caudovirales phage TaxID=2100421 RepID=A0A6J5SD29_9CAUD|nr:hypothetical protein UFOVP442_56 [uncultured Caudovirales phage]CAB4211790.1 hypothetical protein UFOVP1414_21 [uncultured Caudovirales phage]